MILALLERIHVAFLSGKVGVAACPDDLHYEIEETGHLVYFGLIVS